MTNANDRQVGGLHYKKPGLQHWDLAVQHGDNRYLENQVTRYLSRWRTKNGLEDLEKAVHYMDKLVEEVRAERIKPALDLYRVEDWLYTRAEGSTPPDALVTFCDSIEGLTYAERTVIYEVMAWRGSHNLVVARERLTRFVAQVRAHGLSAEKRESISSIDKLEPVVRPTYAQWALELAQVTAKRATCPRRKVGTVLLDRYGRVLATGYNGPARGQPHCTDTPCPGATAPSGTGLEACEAIHAEQNALMQCRDAMLITFAAVTASPCVTCVKMLLNTACEEIAFLEEYPHPAARILWEAAGRKWTKLTL